MRLGGNQLQPAARGQAVIACAARVWRCLPAGVDPAALQEPLKCGVKCAVVDHEFAAGLMLEKLTDTVGVVGSYLQAAQDEHVQRTLQKLEWFRWIVYRRHSIHSAAACALLSTPLASCTGGARPYLLGGGFWLGSADRPSVHSATKSTGDKIAGATNPDEAPPHERLSRKWRVTPAVSAAGMASEARHKPAAPFSSLGDSTRA
ncbi:hypothetical protein SBA3_530004 [Candidatus Sulfopaludibacter sp. SbA3]|nr:hypothetical protein SBA3_530004 [Candidatus Sulfopaludibacter sp. SbA3]